MSYIDGFVIAVPTANKQQFIDHGGGHGGNLGWNFELFKRTVKRPWLRHPAAESNHRQDADALPIGDTGRLHQECIGLDT